MHVYDMYHFFEATMQIGCAKAKLYTLSTVLQIALRLRHQSLYPLVVFTSHDARYFPSIRQADGQTEVLFDRILCDVMCSSVAWQLIHAFGLCIIMYHL